MFLGRCSLDILEGTPEVTVKWVLTRLYSSCRGEANSFLLSIVVETIKFATGVVPPRMHDRKSREHTPKHVISLPVTSFCSSDVSWQLLEMRALERVEETTDTRHRYL